MQKFLSVCKLLLLFNLLYSYFVISHIFNNICFILYVFYVFFYYIYLDSQEKISDSSNSKPVAAPRKFFPKRQEVYIYLFILLVVTYFIIPLYLLAYLFALFQIILFSIFFVFNHYSY